MHLRKTPSESLSTPPRQRESRSQTQFAPEARLSQWQSLMSDSPVVAHQAKRQEAVDAGSHMVSQHKAVSSISPVVQAKVIAGGRPATMLNKANAFVAGERIPLNGRAAEWVTDGYRREYDSTEEFKSHMRGAPVNVGLSKKLGRWYRLPFFSQHRFFVLGENHGAFGYRELIRESNQPGKVLGEGGSNAFLSATDASPLAQNPQGLKDSDGNPRESMMENVTAKAYFGLSFVRKHCEDQLGSGAASSGPVKRFLPESQWIANYQNAPPDRRQTGSGLNKVPFYLDQHNVRVYAKFGTKAENYNPLDTAFKVVEDLDAAMAAYPGVLNANSQNVQARLAELIVIKNQPAIDYQAMQNKIDELYPLLNTQSFLEANTLSGGVDTKKDLLARHAVVKTNLPRYTAHQKSSFAHRDYVMLQSIRKARGDHIMAGLGDNHAQNLQDDLRRDGIPLVRFAEFIAAPYSIDALAPLSEEPGHDKKVEQSEIEKNEYLAALYFKMIARLPPSFGALVPATPRLSIPLPLPMRNLLIHIARSSAYVENQVITPDMLGQFQQRALMQGGEHLGKNLARISNIGKPGAQSSTALVPSSSGGQTAGALSRGASRLAQLRDTLANIFILPPSHGEGSGRELALVQHGAPQAISLGNVFEQFSVLLQMAGPIQFDTGATLLESFQQILQKIREGESTALVPASQYQQGLRAAVGLHTLLQTYGLGSLTIADILRMVQSSKTK